MKTKMLFASWACYVLMSTVAYANDETKLSRDTIVIMPDSNVKIIFIGDALSEMSTYQRIDTVKNMLINDVQKAQGRPGYPASAKTTHYFISAEGKRRLKAESEDYLEQEVNVEKERRSLNLGLLPYAYFIHDFSPGYEIQIYLKDPSQLNSLANYNLASAIKTVANDKKVQRKSFRADLERRDNEWILKQTPRLRDDLLEITPSFGFGLIGNQWSPAIGADIALQLSNKYGKPAYRFAFGLLGYTFTPANNMDFSNINFLQSYSLKFLFNLSTSGLEEGKNKWFGLSAGWMNTTDESMLDKRFKVGMISEGFGPFSFAFDLIFLKDKKSVYGMTMLIPF